MYVEKLKQDKRVTGIYIRNASLLYNVAIFSTVIFLFVFLIVL